MKQGLRLGTAKTNITPEWPVPLAGFAMRSGMGSFRGVSHPLYARTLLFRHEDERGNETSALLVSADLIWWGSERIPRLKERIRSRWGIAGDHIIFHGTHTHSGPQTSGRFSSYLGKPDAAYLEWLDELVLEGIAHAAADMEAVSVERGRGTCGIGIYRRPVYDAAGNVQPGGRGPADPELNVVRFVAEDGSTKAALVHYACHPVITRDNLVSSEFTGVAMEIVENALGGGAISAYLQGCCGDINPGRDGQNLIGSDPEVREQARILADAALQALAGPLARLPACPLSARTRTVALPLERLPSAAMLEAQAQAPDYKGEWARRLLAEPARLTPDIALEMTRLTLADGLSLLAMNGEIVVEYGLFAKRISAGETLPLGYCNGMFGYVPTARQLREGGYESVDSTFYFCMPGPFDPVVETRIRAEMTALLS